MPVAEPLAPGDYVTFPHDYGAPAPYNWKGADEAARGARSPLGTPSTGTGVGTPQSYNGWMRRTKWFAGFMGAAAAMAQLWDAYNKRAPGEWGQQEWGFMFPQGTTGYCTNMNGMPMDGPWAVWSNPPEAVCNFQHGPAISTDWYQMVNVEPFGGVSRGWYDHGNGNYTAAWLRQVRPSPLSSPQIWFYGAMVLSSAGPAGGGHPELAKPLFYAPVPNPFVDVVGAPQPTDRSIPGTSVPMPRAVADALGQFAPSTESRTPVSRPPSNPPAPPVEKPRGPPSERPRERKWRAGKALSKALQGVNAVTEGADFMEAAWWALSPESRKAARRYFGHKPNFMERAMWTAMNPQDVNVADLLENLANNQAGDRVGGMAGKHTKDWHGANWNSGWDSRGRGPFETWGRMPDWK